ncbi:GATA transcription factor 18-like [Solanum pennellii]|uniref:GATA transcription factor 18-like n=1 Tax=Solanum pennellii TaxID=28526 RepID=A0ABM1G2T2_SOLPN|nr:GATA transcription factor 18-like [Solanum pennellii]
MNSCGNAYCHGGPCTCNLYYNHENNNTSAYSMLYHEYHQKDENHSENMYSFASSPSSSSSSVDCTLSLGTPSTRLSNDERRLHDSSHEQQRRSSSYMSKCWNLLQNKNNHTSSTHHHKSGRGSSNNINSSSNNADPLVARRCANCDTTSTPLWRNGPRGPKSLCNACGIRFKKEERRASAAAAANGIGTESSTQHAINGSWVHHSQGQKMPCYTSAYGNHEFRFIEDHDDRESDNAISFWPFLASQHC